MFSQNVKNEFKSSIFTLPIFTIFVLASMTILGFMRNGICHPNNKWFPFLKRTADLLYSHFILSGNCENWHLFKTCKFTFLVYIICIVILYTNGTTNHKFMLQIKNTINIAIVYVIQFSL